VRKLVAGAGFESPALRPGIALAERGDGDIARGDDVLLDERRRNLQCGRDVA
jgi:hypothetical protein